MKKEVIVMKYKLKDEVSFNLINRKSIKKFDFDLSDYYNKETRIFEFPKSYITKNIQGPVTTFHSFVPVRCHILLKIYRVL